jgi:hypothetical protein
MSLREELTYAGLEKILRQVYLSVRYLEVRQRPPNKRRIGMPVLNIKAVKTRDNASPYL